MKTPSRKPCCIRNCRKSVGPSEKSNKCHFHRRMAFKNKFPLKYSFGYLRRRAKVRGVVFKLTYAEYEAFAIKTDYARMKGRSSLSLSVDRIENSLGYYPWNIQAMTIRENARKQYVPYFNGGKMPQRMAEQQHHFDKEYRARCEGLARSVGAVFEPGTKEFWRLFRHRKIKMFEQVTA